MRATIAWDFQGMNEFIKANRTGYGKCNAGNRMKARDQALVAAQLPRWRAKGPVYIHYSYFCPNKRRDKDNISGYFHKVFQDAMVERGCLKDDGWDWIAGFSDDFFIDRKNPRVEVEVLE